MSRPAVPAQTASFARLRRQPHRLRQVVVQPVQPHLSGIFSRQPRMGSPVFPLSPLPFCRALRPRRDLHAKPSGVSVLSAHICTPPTPAMLSFRGSITRPPDSLCTLRAGVAADYATLASEWWLAFLVPSSQTAGLTQSISLLLCTSFDYGLSTARTNTTPIPLDTDPPCAGVAVVMVRQPGPFSARGRGPGV